MRDRLLPKAEFPGGVRTSITRKGPDGNGDWRQGEEKWHQMEHKILFSLESDSSCLPKTMEPEQMPFVPQSGKVKLVLLVSEGPNGCFLLMPLVPAV